jgi:hypothetical protein
VKPSRLLHFSDAPTIARFEPRPVRVPASRSPGMDWLNGPLVWAIDEWQAPLYVFPRDCPRILIWPKPETSAADLDRYWQGRDCRMIAHIEWAWHDRLRRERLYRYELPVNAFESLNDVGMHVCRGPVEPLNMTRLDDLPRELDAAGVELRVMADLVALKGLWATSLHVSGIRLRNALGWLLSAQP